LDLYLSTSCAWLFMDMSVISVAIVEVVYIGDEKSGKAAFQGSDELCFLRKRALYKFNPFDSQGLCGRRFRIASERPDGKLIAGQQISSNPTALFTRCTSD
jgi:hypothetical protein